MRRRAIPLLPLCCLLASATVVDRIAVIVGTHAVKTSDIERDLRVTSFLNHEPLDLSAAAKHKAAERLIDQSIIRDEIIRGDYSGASPADVDAMVKKITALHFGGSTARMKGELARYGLTEEQLRTQLQWQLDVLQFIEQRFRPGVLVTDQEVQDYYNQHQAALKQSGTFAALEPKIRATLEEERLNRNYEQWVASARTRTRIVYRQEALQ